MPKQLAIGTALVLVSCTSPPERSQPVFHLCESNVASVRTASLDSPDASTIEVQLRNSARREFELLAKRHFGQEIQLAAGDVPLGRVNVLFGFRTGRISFSTEPMRVEEVFELLDPPPKSPCGSAV